uniref:Uncharacterized protein n=1 Tax=uncultured prokaryote TaxID=198431 RepID=A0A0H5Q1Z0_9ZZZZ|nr:hypothetical protein [uncultured prokaryote]
MVKVNFEFDWGTTGEIQDTGFWCLVSQDGVASFGDWDEITAAIAQRGVEAWKANIGQGNFSEPLIGRRVVAYHYRQDHKEILDRAEYGFSGANEWKGTATSPMPPENTVVVSLYGYDPSTYTPQRARKRGRMYMPTFGATQMGAGGVLASSTQQGWLDVTKNFFNDFTSALDVLEQPSLDDTHARPYVVSVAGQIATKVTHLRVGRVTDTQRRRRNRLPEEYIQAPINT